MRNLDRIAQQSETHRNITTKEQHRWAATENHPNLLATLTPPLIGERFDARQLRDYLQVSQTTLMRVVKYHHDEMLTLGYTPGGPTRRPTTYPPRAVLHIALIMRPGTSARADQIKKALNQPTTPSPETVAQIHSHTCHRILSEAFTIAEAVQDLDPADVWHELRGMDRYDLQALAVALGALVPLDQNGLRGYLHKVGRDHLRERGQGSNGRDASVTGLAVLIPPKPLKVAS
jgi:hypothetical protein